jgi:hypothetical protein
VKFLTSGSFLEEVGFESPRKSVTPINETSQPNAAESPFFLVAGLIAGRFETARENLGPEIFGSPAVDKLPVNKKSP